MALFINLSNFMSYHDELNVLMHNTKFACDEDKFLAAIDIASEYKCTNVRWYSPDLVDIKFGLFWTVSLSCTNGQFIYE